jgi:hypothetical protein
VRKNPEGCRGQTSPVIIVSAHLLSAVCVNQVSPEPASLFYSPGLRTVPGCGRSGGGLGETLDAAAHAGLAQGRTSDAKPASILRGGG